MINNSTEKKKDETKACQRTLQANYEMIKVLERGKSI